MTCAQGLLRLLWGGGPKLECYGTDHITIECSLLTAMLVRNWPKSVRRKERAEGQYQV